MNKFESLSTVWVFTEPAIYEEQVTVPLPTALTHTHSVTACECLLLIFFLPQEIQQGPLFHTQHTTTPF